jgi:hypothetical protein
VAVRTPANRRYWTGLTGPNDPPYSRFNAGESGLLSGGLKVIEHHGTLLCPDLGYPAELEAFLAGSMVLGVARPPCRRGLQAVNATQIQNPFHKALIPASVPSANLPKNIEFRRGAVLRPGPFRSSCREDQAHVVNSPDTRQNGNRIGRGLREQGRLEGSHANACQI